MHRNLYFLVLEELVHVYLLVVFEQKCPTLRVNLILVFDWR